MNRRPSLWMLVTVVVLLLAGWGAHATGSADVRDLLFAAAGVLPVVRLVAGIVADLRSGRPGVDVIALLAVVGAIGLGEYLTAGIIGLMLATGQYLDEYAAGRAERELTALIDRAPREAHRLIDGTVTTVDLGSVVVGDRLLVKPGEVVPVDGVVVGDRAVLDESALTGEALPVERGAGDVVNSGAVNGAGSFELRAIATAERSTYEGIIRLVRDAQTSRAPVVRLADRWAAWFVPLTLAVAAVAWAWSGDPIRALAVLVVATPCPLLLAVPIAIVAGMSRAAGRGIIFRGGGPLEALAHTEAVLVDKTGTLTMGTPTLRSVVGFGDAPDEMELLRIAASLDQTSTHLLARAIVTAARDRELTLSFPEEMREEPGRGVAGVVDGRPTAVGNREWMRQCAVETAGMNDFTRRMLRVAPLSVFIAIDGRVAGAITFDDVIRTDAATTIRALRRTGVTRVVMATGDHPVVANSVGLALGVDQVLAECSPADKVDALEELRGEGTTAMVGDGINDAPALATADIGVAMGARGATASSEAADVVLMVDRLQLLVDGIRIAQRSRSIALQSVALGMGLSLIAMGWAAAGLLPPIAGALTQELIDVLAIANALRALGSDRAEHRAPVLPPDLSARLKAEHDELIPRLDAIRETADELDRLPPDEAHRVLESTRRFLVDEVLPHEAEDERAIYPQIARLLEGEDPLASMSRSHREIFHLIDVFGRVLDDLDPDDPEPADLRDLRRLLYSLHAILRLHFDQEEELYSSLDDTYERNDDAPATLV